MDTLSGVVVGYGSIGQRHFGNLRSLGVEKLGVVDTDPDKRATAEADGADVTYESVSAALDDGPDFTVVAVPNSYHVEVAREVVESGCPVLVEKPLSHTAEGVDELIAAASEHDLTTLVGCNMRFHPAIETVERLVSKGTVGQIVSARIEAGSYLPEWHPDEDYREMYSARESLGGGAVLDYIHEIDYMRWLLGDVSSVTAMVSHETSLDIETESVAGAVLEFRDGCLGELHVDYVQRPYSRSCQLVGEAGTIRWEWGDGSVEWYDTENETWVTESLPTDWELNQMYLDEMSHFLHCVETGSETICPLPAGRDALEVALAVKTAAKTEQHVSVSG